MNLIDLSQNKLPTLQEQAAAQMGIDSQASFPPPAEIPKTIPYTPQGYNPTIPSLEEQAQKSLGIGGAKLDTSVPEATPEEDTNSIDYLTRGNNYVNALEAILQNAKPKPDPEKEKRYKQRAVFNSIGEGLKTVFEGVNHTRGMNVVPSTGAVAGQSNAALAAYNDDMEKKMDAYKNLVTQGKISGLNYKEQLQTMGDQMNMEFARQKSINQQKANELQFERWYKTTSLDQGNKQFLAKLFQDGQISMLEMKRKEGESLQQHKDRMAMLAEQRRNNNLDYAASMNRGSYDKTTAPIPFINNGQPDEISPSAVRTMALARQKELESKMVDRFGKPDPDALKEAAQTPGEYQQIIKYLQGGLTVPEMQILAQDLYTTDMQAQTKQFSKNDRDAAYQRVYGGQKSTPESGEGYTIQSW